MKRLTFALALGVLLFAQTTGTVTITIPSDVMAAYGRAHEAQYAERKLRAGKLNRPMTEETDPRTVQGALNAELATVIADKVFAYAPADAPPRQGNESESERRNRYQSQIRSRIQVR